jgi:hypothetical protein
MKLEALLRLLARPLGLSLIFTAGAACSSTDVDAAPGPTSSTLGRRGVLSFDLAPRSEPAAGENAFHLCVSVAASGAPLTGARVSASSSMPAMGHASAAEAVAHEEGDGCYAIDGVVYSMPGTWKTEFSVLAGGTADEILVEYDVQLAGLPPRRTTTCSCAPDAQDVRPFGTGCGAFATRARARSMARPLLTAFPCSHRRSRRVRLFAFLPSKRRSAPPTCSPA